MNWKTRGLDRPRLHAAAARDTRTTPKRTSSSRRKCGGVAADAPVKLSDDRALRWQAGVFLFTQNYEQDAVNTFSPFVLLAVHPFPVNQYSPVSTLDDFGLGVFGQGTVTLNEKLDLVAGCASTTKTRTPISRRSSIPRSRRRRSSSPRTASRTSRRSSRWPTASEPDNVYATVGERLQGRAASTRVPGRQRSLRRGDDLEPRRWTEDAPGQRSGRAQRRGVLHRLERPAAQRAKPDGPGAVLHRQRRRRIEQGRRVRSDGTAGAGLDVFGAFGYTHARFSDGSTSIGLTSRATRSPTRRTTPPSVGVQYGRSLIVVTVYGRADVVFYGGVQVRRREHRGSGRLFAGELPRRRPAKLFFAEGWIQNAFDTTYIPVAFAYGPLAPSGFIGENGAPRTFGVRAGGDVLSHGLCRQLCL